MKEDENTGLWIEVTDAEIARQKVVNALLDLRKKGRHSKPKYKNTILAAEVPPPSLSALVTISQSSSGDVHRETAQHSLCYDTIFEGTKLWLKLVAPKGQAEILVGWISKTNEHYGTIEEHDVLVAISTTAVATLQNHRRLKRVTQLIAQTP